LKIYTGQNAHTENHSINQPNPVEIEPMRIQLQTTIRACDLPKKHEQSEAKRALCNVVTVTEEEIK
jgi:hypothetical protein